MFCPHILIWWGHTPIRHKHIFEVRLVSVLLDCVLLVVLTSVWMWIWGEFSIVTNGNVINRIMSGVLSSRSDNHQDRKSVFQQIFQVIKNLRRKRKNVIYRQSCFYAECFFWISLEASAALWTSKKFVVLLISFPHILTHTTLLSS